MKKSILILICALFLPALVWAAGNRDFLSMQGMLFDTEGNPIDGNLTMTFRVYDALSGGTALFEESQTVNFDNGVYSASIGSVTSLPDSLFDEESLFIGVQVEGDDELSPRISLFAVPFAKQADVATTALSLADGIVNSSSIAPGSIVSSNIAAGAVGAAELSSSGVAPGTYTLSTITVDADGRITSASNGSGGGGVGTITGVSVGTGLTGGGTSGVVTVGLVAGGVTTTEIADGTITAADISGSVNFTDAQVSDTLTSSNLVAGSSVVSDSEVDDNLTIAGGTINDSVIGGGTPAAGTFTNLQASAFRIQESAGDTSQTVMLQVPSIAADYSLTLPVDDGLVGQILTTDGNGVLSWTSANTDGSDLTNLNATNITLGTLNDARLSANVSLFGSGVEGSEVTDGTLSNSDLSATANIAWTKISTAGAVAADVGAAPASHSHDVAQISGVFDDNSISNTITVGALGSVNDAALSANVTKLGQTIDSSEIVDATITSSDISNSAAITDAQVNNDLTVAGGTINSSVIGGTTPAAGTFTDFQSNNVTINDGVSGNETVSLLVPDIAASYDLTLPVDDGLADQVLTTDGNGVLSWVTPSSSSADITGVIAGSGLTGGATNGDATLSVDGPNVTNLNASNIASGTLNDARLSANVSLLGSSVDSSEVTDGTLTNADINASAGIAWTKLNKSGAVPGDVGAAAVVHTHDASGITDGSLTAADLSASAAIDDGQIDNDLTIVGGTVNNTVIGGSTPAAGTFTNFQSNNVAIKDGVSGNETVTFLVPDIAAGYSLTLPVDDGLVGQILTTDGDGILSWVNMDGSSLNNLNASNISSGTLNDARLSANVSLLGSAIESSEVTDGTLVNADINAGAAIAWTKINKSGALPGDVGAAAAVHAHDASDITSGSFTDAQVNNDLTIADGTVDNTVIGGSTPAAGTFTNLQTTGFNVHESAGDTSHNVTLQVSDIAANYSLTLPVDDGLTGQILTTDGDGVLSWTTLSTDGSSLTNLNASNVTSGTINDARLSANVSLLGSGIEGNEVTDGTLANSDLSASANIAWTKINTAGAVAADVGAAPTNHTHDVSQISGVFDDNSISNTITVGASGTVNDAALSANVTKLGQTIDSSEIVDATITSSDISNSANISDAQVSDTLTSSNLVSAGSVVSDSEVDNNLTISGGTVDNTVIGGSAAAAGTFTNFQSNNVAIKDSVSGNETVSLLVPDIAANYSLTLPVDNGLVNQVLTTDGDGILTWTTPSASSLGSAIESSEVTDGTLVDADINATAAIAWTKINKSGAVPGDVGAAAASHTHVASDIASGQIGLSRGGTNADLSATGGANQFLKQSSAGGAVSVGAIADADVPNNITINLAAAATVLAANGTNCSGQVAVGVDASGNAECASVGSSEITDNVISASDLAAALTFADGDFVDLSAVNASSTTEGLRLPQATTVTASTAEGQITWDTDNDRLHVGDGTSAVLVARPNVTNVTDTTTQSLTDADIVITDTNPAITPSSTTSRVMVTVSINFDSDGTDDEVNVFKVWRGGSGCNAGGAVQVGGSLTSFTTNNTEFESLSATFVDSPVTTSATTYRLCHSTDSTGTVSNDTTTVTINLMEIAP